MRIALYPTQPGCQGDHAFPSKLYSCSQSKSRCWIPELLSLHFFQPLPALFEDMQLLFLWDISTAIIWKGSDLPDPILQALLSALCFHFAPTTLKAVFLLPGWKGWSIHPLLPTFRTKWTLGLCCRVGEQLEFPSPEPWGQCPWPSGGFTCFCNPESKIRMVWSPWCQVLVWHLLWQL